MDHNQHVSQELIHVARVNSRKESRKQVSLLRFTKSQTVSQTRHGYSSSSEEYQVDAQTGRLCSRHYTTSELRTSFNARPSSR